LHISFILQYSRFVIPKKEKAIKGFLLSIFFILLISTFIAWRVTKKAVEVETENKFNRDAQIAKHWMQDRLNLYLPIVLGIRIFFEPGNEVSADEWTTYIQRLELIGKYPAISSIAYIERATGQSEDNYVVKYIEPLDGHEKTIGLNLSSDQKRVDLLNSARDEDPTSKGRVTLITAPKEGFEIILPVYKKGPTPITVEERRQALKGFVQVRFAGDKLFQDIFDLVNIIDLNFKVYSGPPEIENLLYDQTQPLSNSNYKAKFTTSETFKFNSQTWYLVATSKPKFSSTPSQKRLPLVVLGSGLILSFAYLGIYLLLARKNASITQRSHNNNR